MTLRSKLGSIRRGIQKRLYPVEWYLQSCYLRLIKKKVSINPIDTDKKYLILAPHSDDEWIGCSQVIINCPNTVICNMDMQGGDSESLHQTRLQEMQSVARRFNKRLITLSSDKVEALKRIIEAENPDFVLLPHFIDWHPEHMQVMKYMEQTIQSGTYSGNVLTYQVSVPFTDSSCSLYLPMSIDAQSFKWSVFNEHYKTQSFMPVKRFISHEYINGSDMSINSAEIFKNYTSEEWTAALNQSHQQFNNRNEIGLYINNLIRVRKYIVRMCNQ